MDISDVKLNERENGDTLSMDEQQKKRKLHENAVHCSVKFDEIVGNTEAVEELELTLVMQREFPKIMSEGAARTSYKLYIASRQEK